MDNGNFDVQFTPKPNYEVNRDIVFGSEQVADDRFVVSNDFISQQQASQGGLNPGEIIYDSNGFMYQVAQDGYAYLIPPVSYEPNQGTRSDELLPTDSIENVSQNIDNIVTQDSLPRIVQVSNDTSSEMSANVFFAGHDTFQDVSETLLRNESHVFQTD